MPDMWSAPVRTTLPLILVRGFGGLDVEEERRLAYQGFNVGSVYPHKRGENYIYEGFILKLIKSDWGYKDGTNVVGYYPSPRTDVPSLDLVEDLGLPADCFSGDKVVLDAPMVRRWCDAEDDPLRSFWVFRYYDLGERRFRHYGRALVRLIGFIQALVKARTGNTTKVNIIAHSMGGLIVREALQRSFESAEAADAAVNKVVTLGTPHRGISFALLRDLGWIPFVDADDELKQFNPENQADPENVVGVSRLGWRFPLERLLCVVGTDFRSYSVRPSALANRLFSVPGEWGPTYNRSDGLVKQAYAVVDGAPRTYVHKCHGGGDSLMTARESYEIVTRFLFGDLRVRLRLVHAQVKRRMDVFGRNEIFFGVSVKPRRVDFDLFHQSAAAENCYGPFRAPDLTDEAPAFPWAGPGRLIWEGFLDSGQRRRGSTDLVMRADIYVGERDVFGIGFSDNSVYRKQLYVRAVMDPLRLEWHADEDFEGSDPATPRAGHVMRVANGGWEFDFGDDNFAGTLRVELDEIPEAGAPLPILPSPPD